MTARLFLGGPWDGRWVDVGADRIAFRVPVPPPDSGLFIYFLRRAVVPGWRIPLAFWVAEGLDPFDHTDYVLPGYVVGRVPESCAVCRQCRGRAAVRPGYLCSECFFIDWAAPRPHEHVWMDGAGNELDHCARCGVPE